MTKDAPNNQPNVNQHGAREMNILFVCSRNQWRSPTAETLYRHYPGVQVRSAGTSTRARHTVSVRDIAWADVIMVMEEKHKSRLRAQFPQALQGKKLVVLDIADDYHYMDAELVTLLQTAVAPYLS